MIFNTVETLESNADDDDDDDVGDDGMYQPNLMPVLWNISSSACISVLKMLWQRFEMLLIDEDLKTRWKKIKYA